MNKKAETEGLGLEEIANGHLAALYHDALKEVVLDMADLNKQPKKARKITIGITFTPSASRREFDIEIGVDTQLAKQEKVTSQGFMAERRGGVVEALGNEAAQMGLPIDGADRVPPALASAVDPVDAEVLDD